MVRRCRRKPSRAWPGRRPRTLVLTSPGRTTVVITNVPVGTDTVTPIIASGSALNPPVSPSGTANGSAPLESFIRVLQPLTVGVTVEISGRFVDGAFGAYSYPLVINAPLVAPFAPVRAVLTLAADPSVAGKFALRARLAGFADKTAVLGTLTSGATVPTNLVVP